MLDRCGAGWPSSITAKMTQPTTGTHNQMIPTIPSLNAPSIRRQPSTDGTNSPYWISQPSGNRMPRITFAVVLR